MTTSRSLTGLAMAIAVIASLAAAPAAHAAPVAPVAPLCGTVVNIGFTVLDNGYIKGSGSYTSESCLPIERVTVSLFRNGNEVSSTRVTRYPTEPSSLEFSARPFKCRHGQWADWRTRIAWKFERGLGSGEKYSSTLRVPCA